MNSRISKLINSLPTNRAPSVNRITLNQTLRKIFKNLHAKKVLDVGSKGGPNLHLIKHKKYVRLDISAESAPDIVGDIHEMKVKTGSFDTVIATEVLEHLYDPQKAVDEIYRVLRPGGTVVLSTRFIYWYHPDPQDYYRFTEDSIKYLMRQFSEVKIYKHGNRLQVVWQLLMSPGSGLGIFLNFLNPLIAKINFSDERVYLGLVVVAKK